MFDYLQQFNNLPKELREKVSSPEAMAFLIELEKKYQVDLAVLVMKVMIKSLAIKNLPIKFASEFGLKQSQSENLTKELTEKIFSKVADYLNLTQEIKSQELDKEIHIIIKDAGIVFPSSDLISRFKIIIATYLRGVRSRIATRDALAKEINFGGLNLSNSEIDRVLKICDQKNINATHIDINKSASLSPSNKTVPIASGLDKIISAADKLGRQASEYNLKQAIALGQINRPPEKTEKTEKIEKTGAIDKLKEIEAPDKVSALESPDKLIKIEAPDKVNTLEAPDKIINLPLQKAFEETDLKSIAKLADEVATKLSSSSSTQSSTQSLTKPVTQSPVNLDAKITKPSEKDLYKKLIQIIKPAPLISSPSPAASAASAASAAVVSQAILNPKAAADNKIKPAPVNIPASPSAAKAVAASRPVVSKQGSVARPTMQDVKPAMRLMGPIEELQFLDLINFRRLGKTPSEISAKIFNKIKLLEVDGYDKMIAGVRAWRQSPVNHLYLKMMKEAIGKGMTIKEFALKIGDDQSKYLKLEEIEEIIAMNSKLIF